MNTTLNYQLASEELKNILPGKKYIPHLDGRCLACWPPSWLVVEGPSPNRGELLTAAQHSTSLASLHMYKEDGGGNMTAIYTNRTSCTPDTNNRTSDFMVVTHLHSAVESIHIQTPSGK